ncbi:MAG: amidohydrolase [Actinomycetota bacterium]|nr:MAG: amidohydrolase [Actinomycetota bacterium]
MIKAIDIHVHGHDEAAIQAMGARNAQMGKYFGKEMEPVSLDELADRYRQKEMMAVLVNTTDVSSTGIPPVPNDHIAQAVKRNPDVFIGFGAVDPWQGKLAVDEAKRCAEELGLRGLGELNPGRQGFYPNDPRFYPLWEMASDQGLVVLLHGGMMGAGAGTPGGMGFKLKYTRPIPYIDDVAADFPKLKIIAAHPSWPWQEESLAVARHKSNVYIDLSGWAPKYFPESLVHYVDTILQDRALFGSDWPVLDPDRWLAEFAELPIRETSRQKILLDNACALFGIQV